MSNLTTRSRTNLFLSYRDSRVSYSSKGKGRATYEDEELEDEQTGLMTTDLELGHSSHLPPQWIDLSSKVDAILLGLKPKLSLLDKLHSKHILPGFTSRTEEENNIDALTNDIFKDFRSTQSIIRSIAEMAKSLLENSSRNGQNSESKRLDLIMAANVQTALATKVQELSTGFRKKQTIYLKQLKNYEGRNTDPYRDAMLSPSSPSSQSQFSVQQQQYGPQDLNLENRSNEITSLAQSIVDLSDLFKDLSSLVIDQGTLLDSVGWNVEQMAVDVKGAVEELKSATTYQRRSGKFQCILLLILLVMGAAILLIYKPTRPTVSTPPVRDINEPHQAGAGLTRKNARMVISEGGAGQERGSTRFIGSANIPIKST